MRYFGVVQEILVTGQTSLHWGRMEFGNIGNAYVAAGFFGLLRKWLPNAQISTTLEFSRDFLERYSLRPLAKEVFDSGPGTGLEEAHRDFLDAESAALTGEWPNSSPFLREVHSADLIVDLSGDMWGDNANEIHSERFAVGLYRFLAAQALGKKTALVASSPGPFEGKTSVDLVSRVLRGYNLVLNREARSSQVLAQAGMSLDNVFSRSCPSIRYIISERGDTEKRPQDLRETSVGVTLCGWNIPDSSWKNEVLTPKQLTNIYEFIGRATEKTGARVVLFSHANGFRIEGSDKIDTRGRDYGLLLQVHDYVKSCNPELPIDLEERVKTPKETIELIRSFDLLISGRAHGCVAGLAQGVPTVMIDYANGPEAHKTLGFMELFDQGKRVISLRQLDKAAVVVGETWANRVEISGLLSSRLDDNLQLVDRMGKEIKDLMNAR